MRCYIDGAFGELIRQTIARTRNARNRDPGSRVRVSVRSNLSGCSCRDCAAIIAYECVQPRASREQPRFVSRTRIADSGLWSRSQSRIFTRWTNSLAMKTSARVWPNCVTRQSISRERDHETAGNISAKNVIGESKLMRIKGFLS